ncbi:MAG TPA: hypothetical protein VLW85_04245 [Myxococcales bacterium]|nr:hypothetical protein [Myxococcales bacterium]
MSALLYKAATPTSASPRQAHAVFFRAIVAFLEERGLTARVRERVSEPTRWVIDRPPWIGRWIPSLPVDEIESVLFEIGGAQLNVSLGRFAAEQMVHKRLTPVVNALFAVLGRSPESLFRNLNLCFSLATRGISFAYVAGGSDGKHVVAHFCGQGTPEAAWHALRGALMHAFVISGTRGAVGEPVRVTETEQGVTVRYPVTLG